MSNLMLHSGSRSVDRPTLESIDAPPATDTWFPVRHGDVLGRAVGLLEGAGFRVEKSRYGLSTDNHRFFGVLDLSLPVGYDGVKLAVGIRNSTDKTFPIGLAAGTRVFVCDNLAFSAELTVTRKHTRNGMDRWTEAIGGAVHRLDQFQRAESVRIERLQGCHLGLPEADSFILRAWESGILSTRQLPDAVKQWRDPQYDWGREGTAWHLYNAMTHALGGIAQNNPQRHAGLTMKLMQHFAPVIGEDGAALMSPGSVLPTVRDTDPDEDPVPLHLPIDHAEVFLPGPQEGDPLD